MKYRHRLTVTGEKFAAAAQAFTEIRPTLEILRLAKKTINRRTVITAVIAEPGRPGMRIVDVPAEADEATLATWAGYGVRLAEMVGALPESVHAAAEAAGYDAYASSVLDDLALDEVEAWESLWRAHLGGRLHVQARADLQDRLRALLADVSAAKAPRGRKPKEATE